MIGWHGHMRDAEGAILEVKTWYSGMVSAVVAVLGGRPQPAVDRAASC